MNRIILIGNGFDLAHKLETSYKHFIDWFWKEKCKEINNKSNNDFFELKFPTTNFQGNTYRELVAHLKSRQNFIQFKNNFLKIVTDKVYPTEGFPTLHNWVDIEEEYYQEIRNIILNKSNYASDNNETAITKLNKDFEKIKHELENYLNNEIKRASSIGREDEVMNKIYSKFDVKKDFTKDGIKEMVNELYRDYTFRLKAGDAMMQEIAGITEDNTNYVKEFIKEEVIISDHGYFNLLPQKILLLNFNYTSIENRYVNYYNKYEEIVLTKNTPKTQTIHIHGKLSKRNNSIVFGYGDEQDEIHKEIEKRGGDFLNNVKTINYLKTPNYKNLLDFIESDVYQVFIMGHSCGLSDKTLLNTLFENENCVSIKPFYYINDEGYNNYDDIVKNIYRIFTNKTLMREKVVNLEYCEELSK